MSHHQKVHNHVLHNPILEVIHVSHKNLEKVDSRLSQAEIVERTIHAVTGVRAFREYHWLTDAVEKNADRNLRGMVLSAKWRTAFRYTDRVGGYLENVGLLAGFAASIGEAAPEVDRIIGSNESNAVKGARLAAIAGTAAQRALLGIVPAGVHAIYRLLEGGFIMAGRAGGRAQSVANQAVGTIKRADSLVQSTFKTVTDTRNQANAFWWVIDTVLSPRSIR